MKKTLFLSAILATALCSSAFADQLIPASGDVVSDGSRLSYALSGGEQSYAVNIDFNGKTVWTGPRNDTSGATDRATGDAYVTLSGIMSGTGTWQMNEYAYGGVADVVYALTNSASTYTGTIKLAHGERNDNYVQLTLDNTGTAYQGAQIVSESKGKEIVNINGSASIGGLTGTSSDNRLTGTAGSVLTINTADDVNKSFSGTVGSGNYFTSTFSENAMTEAASSAISLVKQGAGTQRFNGAATLNVLTLSEGTLAFGANSSASSLAMTGGTLTIDAAKTLSVVMGDGSAVSLTGGTISGGGKLFINNNAQKEINTTLDLTTLSSGTTLSLKGVRGTLKGAATGENTVAGNIELTNTTNWAAAELGGSFGTIEGSAYTFTGSISGDGNMALQKNGSTLALTFSGDLSGWTAKGAEWMGLRANGTTALNVLINGSPTNAAIGNAFNANTRAGASLNLTVDRDAAFKGNINVTSLVINAGKTVSSEHATFSTTGQMELKNGAALTVKNATAAAVNTFVAMGDNSSLVLSNNTHMTVNDGYSANGVWINKGANITIKDTANVKVGSLTIGAVSGANAILSRLDAEQTTKIGTHASNYQQNLKLENAAVTYTGSGTLYLGSMQGGSLSSTGNIQLAGTASTIGSLTLSGQTITLGTEAEHDNNLTITTSLAVSGTGSKVNANLVMNSGTMTFVDGAVLTMGCDVTIGDGVKVYITGDIAAIRGGEAVTIIDGLSAEDHISLGSAKVYVNDEYQSDFFLMTTPDSNDSMRIVVAPEPATATLSLLALAGLCARRRRH